MVAEGIFACPADGSQHADSTRTLPFVGRSGVKNVATRKETTMPSQRVSRLVKWSILSMTLGALLGVAAVRSEAQVPDLGIDASLHGKPIFPAGDPWNQD